MIIDTAFSLYRVFVEVGIWPVICRCIIGFVICLAFAGLIAFLWYYFDRDPQDE